MLEIAKLGGVGVSRSISVTVIWHELLSRSLNLLPGDELDELRIQARLQASREAESGPPPRSPRRLT